MMKDSERFYLRAFQKDGDARHQWFVDLVPYIAIIAKFSSDVHIMPPIPKYVTAFTGNFNLLCASTHCKSGRGFAHSIRKAFKRQSA
jgi:hypothetical protein